MNKETLKLFLFSRCIPCSDGQANELEELMNSTLETNKLFNLTAITEPSVFMEKMILDSALGVFDLELADKKVIDVGTGAGYPGLVAYILCPEMQLTLLDATKKKIDYLHDYCAAHQYDVETITGRVEEYAANNRETYDVAFARAVAPLNVLLETIVPLLKVGGKLVAMKGPGAEEEYIQSQNALKKLNCHLQKVYEDTLPECQEKRAIIIIVKDKTTPHKYPRQYSEIKKLPL